MLKAINLLSLVNAKKDLSLTVFSLYLDNFFVKISEDELDDLEALVKQIEIHSQDIEIYDKFFLGYSINQISKEFDLLRFGDDAIINIELKRKDTGKIKYQLKKNKYYLDFLKKDIFNFTYINEENKLLYLENGEELIEVDFEFLINKLTNQKIDEIEDINRLFDPSNYLVSPFNSTDKFIKGKYFLTNHQECIKKEILNDISSCFISISGAAGTGKTLLTYDIAKEYINDSKKVLIFHCGNLNTGHNILKSKYLWPIAPIKSLKNYDISIYDIIIIDEVQRIYTTQLDILLKNSKNNNIRCIFSYDYRQCLRNSEINRNIPKYIKEQVSPKIFKLTEKIRTNKEIASFIKNLFDLSKVNKIQEYPNINVKYFSNENDAKRYLKILSRQDWKIINYTPSRYKLYYYTKYEIPFEDNAHKVIGQEYDKVVAVIDKHFHYNSDGILITKGYKQYYHQTKMLFQILTRTRKKLKIIIINNEELLNKCLQILNK